MQTYFLESTFIDLHAFFWSLPNSSQLIASLCKPNALTQACPSQLATIVHQKYFPKDLAKCSSL